MFIDGDDDDSNVDLEGTDLDVNATVTDTDDVDTGDDDALKAGKDKTEGADEKPVSIRDSLKKAFKEQTELENKNEDTPKGEKPATTAKPKSAEDSNTQKPVVTTSKPAEAIKPPVGWTKEAKAEWNKLPPAVQASVAKREKEVSDGFAQYGETARRYKELNDVLEPRRAAIQSHGVSEAQIINNLFQWMEGLADPNKKLEVFKQLGQNFKIDISTLVPSANQQQTDQNQNQNTSEIPPHLQQWQQTVDQQVSTLLQQQQEIAQRDQAQRAQAAEEFVTNWAKDKPHFPVVRGMMSTLLNSGAIPMKNGGLDLDEAYLRAIYATPEVRETYLAEQEELKAAAAKVEADKKRIANINRINAAKKAGVSLKASAPSAPVNNNSNKKMNGKPTSVRDSIRAAVEEVTNQ